MKITELQWRQDSRAGGRKSQESSNCPDWSSGLLLRVNLLMIIAFTQTVSPSLMFNTAIGPNHTEESISFLKMINWFSLNGKLVKRTIQQTL